MNIYLT